MRGEREGETAEKTGFLAGQATNRRPETQVTHPDSTNNQTPSILRPFYHPVRLHSATLLFFVALLLSSLRRGSSAFAPPRGKHRGVWKILTGEAGSPRGLWHAWRRRRHELEHESRERREEGGGRRGENKRERYRDSYREKTR